MSFFAPPNQQRSLRACMVCSVVQSHTVSALFSFLASVIVNSELVPSLTGLLLLLEIHAWRLP